MIKSKWPKERSTQPVSLPWSISWYVLVFNLSPKFIQNLVHSRLLWCDHNHCDDHDSCRSSRTFNGAIMIIAMTMQRLTWIQRSWSSSFINMFLKVVIIFAFQCLNVFNLFSLVIQTLKNNNTLYCSWHWGWLLAGARSGGFPPGSTSPGFSPETWERETSKKVSMCVSTFCTFNAEDLTVDMISCQEQLSTIDGTSRLVHEYNH